MPQKSTCGSDRAAVPREATSVDGEFVIGGNHKGQERGPREADPADTAMEPRVSETPKVARPSTFAFHCWSGDGWREGVRHKQRTKRTFKRNHWNYRNSHFFKKRNKCRKFRGNHTNATRKKADVKNTECKSKTENREDAQTQGAPQRRHEEMGGTRDAGRSRWEFPDRRKKDSGARRGLNGRNVRQTQTDGHVVNPEMSMPRGSLKSTRIQDKDVVTDIIFRLRVVTTGAKLYSRRSWNGIRKTLREKYSSPWSSVRKISHLQILKV